jgi:hypothetical protein
MVLVAAVCRHMKGTVKPRGNPPALNAAGLKKLVAWVFKKNVTLCSPVDAEFISKFEELCAEQKNSFEYKRHTQKTIRNYKIKACVCSKKAKTKTIPRQTNFLNIRNSIGFCAQNAYTLSMVGTL